MNSPRWVRSILGWSSVVLAAAVIAAFVLAAVHHSGVIAAISVGLMLVLAGCLWPWVALQGARDELVALGPNENYREGTSEPAGEVQAPKYGFLLKRHPRFSTAWRV